MIYKTIPNTDINASAISLGTAEIGGIIDIETSYKMLDLYIENGGNLIDTANIEQLKDSLKYADLQLDKQTVEYLEGK